MHIGGNVTAVGVFLHDGGHQREEALPSLPPLTTVPAVPGREEFEQQQNQRQWPRTEESGTSIANARDMLRQVSSSSSRRRNESKVKAIRE